MKKGLTILSGYLFFGLIVSCCKPITHPYFDFQSLIISTNLIENIEVSQIEFNVELEDQVLYTQASFNFFNTAYAFSQCPGNGSQGLKFPIIEVKVSCSQTFFDTISPNQDLSHLFYTKDGYTKVVSLETFDLTSLDGVNSSFLQLYVNKNNLSGVGHVFTFNIKKSNGEVVSATSEPIIWN